MTAEMIDDVPSTNSIQTAHADAANSQQPQESTSHNKMNDVQSNQTLSAAIATETQPPTPAVSPDLEPQQASNNLQHENFMQIDNATNNCSNQQQSFNDLTTQNQSIDLTNDAQTMFTQSTRAICRVETSIAFANESIKVNLNVVSLPQATQQIHDDETQATSGAAAYSAASQLVDSQFIDVETREVVGQMDSDSDSSSDDDDTSDESSFVHRSSNQCFDFVL
jgi:hypothetical protein